ncbi:MAG: hypothetical protein ACTTJG_02480 [Treponema sp.]
MNGKKLISIVGALTVMAATLVFAGCKQPAGGGAGGSGGGATPSGAAIENTVWKVDLNVLKDVYTYYDSTTKRYISAIKVGGILSKQIGQCGTYKLDGNKLKMTTELSTVEECTWKVEGNILTLSEPVNGRGTKTTEVTAAQLKAL